MNLQELSTLYATGHRDFGALDLDEANLRNINLSGANLAGASLNVVNLSGANLSEAQLDGVKLNVARLNATNFYKASLNGAKLNVANLIRANLRLAEVQAAQILHAELVRADLTGANLQGANCLGSDFREANLRRVNLSHCHLRETNFRDVLLNESVLTQADLTQADLSRANLQAADLQGANLSQANLTRAKLQGANLRGANLQDVDLSGADLRAADLQEAQLSGAILVGAELSDAQLINARLVGANLSRSRLGRVNWSGADLTGADLTGAWLYPVTRSRLHTADLVCAWLDLSEMGDGSVIKEFKPTEVEAFFGETPPTVQVTVDAALNWDAQAALMNLYQQMNQCYPCVQQPPSVQVRSRRTYLTFDADRDTDLFVTAAWALWPFATGITAIAQWQTVLQTLCGGAAAQILAAALPLVQAWQTQLTEVLKSLAPLRQEHIEQLPETVSPFLAAPMTVTLTSSSDRAIEVLHHPCFGKPQQQENCSTLELLPVDTTALVPFVQALSQKVAIE